MSAGVWLPDSSGIIRRAKKVPLADLSGIQRSTKTGWIGCTDGVTRKIFSRAVEWTYNISLSGDHTPDAYGNSGVKSAFLHVPAVGIGWVFCSVTYTFDAPLLMRAGSTLTINTIIYNGNGQSDIFLDGTKIYTKYILWSSGQSATESYTFTSDTVINAITVRAGSAGTSTTAVECDVGVTVNSDNGSFLLNNSGIHEIQ